jgi:hypothetical protein
MNTQKEYEQTWERGEANVKDGQRAETGALKSG